MNGEVSNRSDINLEWGWTGLNWLSRVPDSVEHTGVGDF